MPGFSLTLGLLIFAAFAIGGDVAGGAICLGIMAFVGAVFLVGSRSETLQGLGGPGRDERWAMIDLRATALAGLVLITALIAAWLWEIAHGDDGSPYGQLLAIGGLAYILAVALLRVRS
jgi:hypothetical protein